MTTPNFQLPNPANIANGQFLQWNATTGRFVAVDAPGGNELQSSIAINLPFNLPTIGGFGAPDGMTLTFGPSVIGDKFVISAWAEIQNTNVGSNANVQGQLEIDGTPVITVSPSTVLDSDFMLYVLQYEFILIADVAAPAIRAAYKSSFGGVDFIAGAISVTKIAV